MENRYSSFIESREMKTILKVTWTWETPKTGETKQNRCFSFIITREMGSHVQCHETLTYKVTREGFMQTRFNVHLNK